MKGKQRLKEDEGVFGYMIFSIIFFHSLCGGEVDIFMFSVINSRYTKDYNINFC